MSCGPRRGVNRAGADPLRSGLVRDSDDWWVFIDRPAGELNKQASAQGVLIYCLQRALWLAQRFEPQRVPTTRLPLQQLRTRLHHLWDNDQRCLSAAPCVRSSMGVVWIWLVLALAPPGSVRRDAPPAAAAARHCHEHPYLRHHIVAPATVLWPQNLRERRWRRSKYWGRWSLRRRHLPGNFDPNILTFPMW